MYNKFIHFIAAIVLFAIPVILGSHAGFLDITIGSILNGIYLYFSQITNPTASVKK
jgi:hypothetical protein